MSKAGETRGRAVVKHLRATLPTGKRLQRGERFVKSRFAAISGIWVNDSALGGLIDRGDDGANLIAGRACCGAHLLLHRTQTRDGAAIAKRSLHGLTGALGG